MKILVDLNIKHKITMIMVTHDQGLKNFANRVVKMSDGKILKIVDTNKEVRRKMILDLNNKCEAHEKLKLQIDNVLRNLESTFPA